MVTAGTSGRSTRPRAQARLQQLLRARWAHAREWSRDLLAARLPGGSALKAREVPMWKRSEVEQLTGLTRHMIQDLCNQNVAGDGLGFWEPAVSKPGYSRFDEGDLLAFYLVRQLTKAGFTLKEIEPAVFDLLEESDAFAQALRAKERRLRERRSKLDASLQVLSYLEDAATAAPGERLPTVMGEALEQSAQRALVGAAHDVRAAGEPLPAAVQAHVARRAHVVIAEVVGAVQGDVPQRLLGVAEVASEETVHKTFSELAGRLAGLLEAGEKPASRGAAAFSWALAGCLAGRGHEAEAAGQAREDAEPAGLHAARRYALRVLARFLSEPENGVPVELVLGNGSFTYVAQATAACVDGMKHTRTGREGA